MKVVTILRSLLVSLMLVGVAWAADVSGKWRAEFQGPDGSAAHNIFTFQVEGEKLTGTVYSSFSNADAKIEEGTVKGDALAFAVTRNFQGTDIKLRYKGTVKGEEIAITMAAEGGGQTFELQMTAKRQK